MGHPEVEERNLHPPWKHPGKGNGSVNGVVPMETRRQVEERKEEERWRKLYPEIKKCVIVIARQSFDDLNMLKLKREEDGKRREEERGGRRRSGDPEPKPDWVGPVELDGVGGGEVRFTRFVKMVEVKIQPKHVRYNGTRRPGQLRLSQSPDVTSDPADPAHRHHAVQSDEEMEQIAQSRKEISNNISQSGTDHNYSLNTKEPDTPGTPSSQSLDTR